jgi:hypothetical protein
MASPRGWARRRPPRGAPTTTRSDWVSALVYDLGRAGEVHRPCKAYDAYPGSDYIASELLRLSSALGYRQERLKWERLFARRGDGGGGVDVVVFFSHGFAPVKEPVSLPIPLHDGFVLVSIPVYRFDPSRVDCAVMSPTPDQGMGVKTSSVLDIDAMAARNLRDKLPVLLVKQAARAFMKAQAVRGMERSHRDWGGFMGTVLAVVTEQADLRTWSTLPKQIQAGRIFVPQGVHRVRIEAAPAGVGAYVDIPPGARHIVVLCRHTDAGFSVHTRSY